VIEVDGRLPSLKGGGVEEGCSVRGGAVVDLQAEGDKGIHVNPLVNRLTRR